jgi:AcrR family transcriptional regulator
MIPEIFTSDPSWPYTKAKTAVIAAASSVIREEGPRAATLKNIATRAGITEPAIFRHFEGVDGLFEGLFSAYERVHQRAVSAFSGEGRGMAKLREACFNLVASIASSQDFSYVLLNARHVFRGYPELKAKVAENDAKDQGAFLACIAEGIKSGEIRSDIDPVSAASSLIGGIHVAAMMWIETAFGFDIREAFKDRWDDFERMVSAKPTSRSREAKAAARDRAAAYFPLRPLPLARSKVASARKAAGAPSADPRRKPKAASPKAAPKKAATRAVATRVATTKVATTRAGAAKAKKPTSKSK